MKQKWIIRVPGSTANLGPGFDSIGLAVNRYLTVEATRADEWYITGEGPHLVGLPTGEDNLLYQVAQFVAEDVEEDLPACRVEMKSELPLARGLGSSASAIVAGIELANCLLDLNLTELEKARYASLYEGHPDNVAASVYGGLVIATHSEVKTHVMTGGVPDLDLVVVIPSYELKTSDSRGVLPEILPYSDAIRGSSVSNVLVAALLQQDWETVGEMMESDLYHQPYRQKLVPEFNQVQQHVKGLPVFGVGLSGAGPTVILLVKKGEGEKVATQLSEHFPDGVCLALQPDAVGVTTEVISMETSV